VAQSRGIEVGGSSDLIELYRKLWGQTERLPDAVIDAYVAETVRGQLAQRMTLAIRTGRIPIESASMLRLFHAETDWQCVDAGLSAAESYAVTGPNPKDAGPGVFSEAYLFRQATSLGGGSTEMARNIISERVIKLPRETPADQKIPFKDVKARRSTPKT